MADNSTTQCVLLHSSQRGPCFTISASASRCVWSTDRADFSRSPLKQRQSGSPHNRGDFSSCSISAISASVASSPAPSAPSHDTGDGLCSLCEGNGVLKIPGGISECPRCKGRCWASEPPEGDTTP